MRLKYTVIGLAAGLAVGAAATYFVVGSPAPAQAPPAPSVAAPTRFETFALALPALGVDRTLRVYLPPGYASCSDCRYPVVYFMDGQNLFDAATGYAGEWGVDEVLDALHARHGLAVIAVGIDHGGEARMQELSVWEHADFAPARGEAFLADLVTAVKPAVDARYRTRPAAEAATIAGSSMGGLMAHAAVMRHPEVFGRALVFSPSYWFSTAIAKETERTPLQPGQRVHVYAGGSEGGGMLTDAEAMVGRWKATLPQGAALQFSAVQEAGHNEAAWRAALPGALCWTFAPACEAPPPAP